jgi:hypothetical protein
MNRNEGKLLSHLQGFYRAGDRDLAVELMNALGLGCVEVRTSGDHSLTRIHMNSNDRNTVDNVLFLSEMLPHQARLEAVLEDRMAADGELRDAVTQFRNSARSNGDGSPHFGVHFATNADLDSAIDAVQNRVSPALAMRVSIKEMPSYGIVADFPDMRQVFLHTDVFAIGSITLGQTIELQVERGS